MSRRDILISSDMSQRDISILPHLSAGDFMCNEKLFKSFLPMTETAFYILLSLSKPRHGYGIIIHVEEITKGRINLGSGTVYGTLTKFQKKGIISVYSDEKRRTIYEITDLGKELISKEIERLTELYNNAIKAREDFHV